MGVQFHQVECKSALTKIRRNNAYQWDCNAYRGCTHNCQYCFALYSHSYLEGKNFYHDVFVKTNIVEELERQLSSPKWKGEVINLGGVTDSYQAAEAKYKIMPEIWRLLIQYNNPAIISTKSTLILRDYDLIAELASRTYVSVAATVTTMDESVRSSIEQQTASSADRFAMLKSFSKTRASVGLHLMPIIPYLTDGEENFEALFSQAEKSGVDYVIPGILRLRGETREKFLAFLFVQFPDIYPKVYALYEHGRVDKEYRENTYNRVQSALLRHGLSTNYLAGRDKRLPVLHETRQLSFI